MLSALLKGTEASASMSMSFEGAELDSGNQTPPKIDPKYEVDAGPRVDRKTYLQSYSGSARFERQLHIGLHSKSARNEYLLGAFDEAKNGQNAHHYILAREACIHFELIQGPGGQDAWLNDCEKRNRAEKMRLDTDLRSYKQRQIKEQMRAGYEELANFYVRSGDYKNAHEQYKKLRHIAETEEHLLAFNLAAVALCLEEKAWGNTISTSVRLQSIASSSFISAESGNTGMRLYSLACGLSHLALANELPKEDKYRRAAASFLFIPAGLGSAYNNFASSNNVAMYGAVCALATMSRSQLQRDCLVSTTFRTYLELEPQIRKAISHFINGKYSACLSIIESYRNDFLLDVYLGEHTEKLLRMIRDRCIVHYCYPFSVVKLETLSEQFCQAGEDIIEELVDLIKEGQIKAKIDVMAGTLNSVSTPPRTEIQLQTLESVQNHERELRRRILHMSIVNAQLEVKSKKTQWGPGEGVGASSSSLAQQGYGGFSGGGVLGQVMADYVISSGEDETFGDDDEVMGDDE